MLYTACCKLLPLYGSVTLTVGILITLVYHLWNDVFGLPNQREISTRIKNTDYPT